MRIELHDGFYLSPVREGDQAAYLAHFTDEQTLDWMLVIPFPYTPADADFWVRTRIEASKTQPHETHFAIRRADDFLVGGIGLKLNEGMTQHRAEVGYWLARDYRNRGVATAAVRAVAAYAFGLGLLRLEATTFVPNRISQRVLEKAGFICEGVLRSYHLKKGQPIDACMYACIAPPKAPPR